MAGLNHLSADRVMIFVMLMILAETAMTCQHTAALARVTAAEIGAFIVELDLLLAHDQWLVPLRRSCDKVAVIISSATSIVLQPEACARAREQQPMRLE